MSMDTFDVDYGKLIQFASQCEKIKIYPETQDFWDAMSHSFYIEWEDLSGPVFQYLQASGKEKYRDLAGETKLSADEWCIFWVTEEGTLYRLNPDFEEIKQLENEQGFYDHEIYTDHFLNQEIDANLIFCFSIPHTILFLSQALQKIAFPFVQTLSF